MKTSHPRPALQTSLFRPGMRVAIACSGGADSVALLRVLQERKEELGLVLSVAHMNHQIRGEESEADANFCAELAARYAMPFLLRRTDVPAVARSKHQGLEEAARALRYTWFWELLAGGEAETVVTAHTLDDQAETVLHRLLRGAWTEGLAGIYPVIESPQSKQPGMRSGTILRPFLSTTRTEIEQYLRSIGQPWSEDSTNSDTTYTRNRIRHELLPALAEYNPGVQDQLANLAVLARDEESYWQLELTRLLPSLLLPGKAVRGGGRARDTLAGGRSLSIEAERLRGLHSALQRRVLRAAADRLGVSLSFQDTDRLLTLCGAGFPVNAASSRSGSRLQMQNGLRAERTPRELRLYRVDQESRQKPEGSKRPMVTAEYTLPVPGRVEALEFGLALEASLGAPLKPELHPVILPPARLRASRAGDRVTLRHSHSRLKIKEALKRSRSTLAVDCPVLEWQGEIIWLPGVAINSLAAREFGLRIDSTPLRGSPSPEPARDREIGQK